MALLETKNLTKSFGALTAVDGVSLAVETGTLHSIIGPNGAGKTTLFNLLTGAFAPSAGDILLDGRRITGTPAHRVAHLGIARSFQRTNVFPALSLLVGSYLGSARRGILLALAVAAALLGIAIALAAPFAIAYESEAIPSSLLGEYLPWLSASGLALAVGGVLSAVFLARGLRTPAVLSIACGGLLLAQVALTGHESLSPSLSAYHIVHKIRDQLKPDTPFYVVETFDHTLLYYLGRKVTMVSVTDELAEPIRRAPGDFLPDAAAFARAWEADADAFAMFNVNDLPVFLKAHPVPMRVIAADPRRVIVRKP